MTILDVIARVCAGSPDARAVEEPSRAITYAELDARSNAIAARLADVGPDKLVGICTKPSIDTVVAMLGVLKAGAAFTLIDITYPPDRIAAMLTDSGHPTILVDRACQGAPVLAGTSQLLIGPQADATSRPRPHVDPANTAYVVFTSGSTGRPKGVVVTHAGIVGLAACQNEMFAIRPTSRVLQFAPLGFDAVVSEVFTVLAAGATLCMEERAPGADIHELLARRRIDVVTLPPSLLRVLSPDGLPELRSVVSAGEACSHEIVERWATTRRMVNAYGPSECTVCATMKVMAGPHDAPTIGKAIAGVRTYVLDGALAQVAIGEAGELYLSGQPLARGYLGRASLTAERFVPDPFGRGERMYRTGDVVRLLDGGELEYVGRTDDQVKVRGFRVEPRESEQALRGLAGVEDLVVMPRARTTGEVSLVAYIVCRPGSLDERTVRDFARQHLPHFLRPAEIVMLDAWPLSPNGKIDRKALAELRDQRAATFAPPQTPTERQLADIACKLLDLGAIDLDRSFFDQGGDSIAAARFAIALGGVFARQIPVGILFESPSLRALAARLDSVVTGASAPRSFVRLRETAARPPIWMPGPVHGNALCYMRLVPLLGDATCYGLQSPGVDGEATPIDNFVTLAAHHVQTMREHQPHGPYILCGWSMGGSLAFEIAVQLERAGETVSHLILIGSTPPSEDHLEAARATMKGYETWRMAYFYVRSLAFSLGLPIALDFDEFSRLPDDQVFERFIAHVRELGPLGADMSRDLARRWLGVVRASLYGFHHHTPSGQFAGRVLNVQPRGANPLAADALVRTRPVPAGNWDNHLTGPVDVRTLGANHYTVMLDPWVDELGALVASWLQSTSGSR